MGSKTLSFIVLYSVLHRRKKKSQVWNDGVSKLFFTFGRTIHLSQIIKVGKGSLSPPMSTKTIGGPQIKTHHAVDSEDAAILSRQMCRKGQVRVKT